MTAIHSASRAVTTSSRPIADASRPAADRPNAAAAQPRSVWNVDLMERPATAPTAEQVARKFYEAFEARDYVAMEPLYAPNVKFEDAIFKHKNRDGAMRMWRKILGDPAQNVFKYELKRMEGDVAIGVWTADYKVFGRPVHNVIESRMTVRDGKIVEHRDSFDLARWARQALPIGGLADSRFVQGALRHVLRGVIGDAPSRHNGVSGLLPG